MTISLRTRRVAVGVAAAVAVAGVPLATLFAPAQAATASIDPSAVIATDAPQTLRVKAPSMFPPVGESNGVGTQVDLVKTGDSTVRIKGNIDETDDSNRPGDFSVVFDFAPGTPPSPYPLGTYDLRVYVGSDTTGGDSCTSCFEIVPVAAPTVTDVQPRVVPNGSTGQPLVIRGTNFNRGSKVRVVLEGTNTDDPNVKIEDAKQSNGDVILPTSQTIQKRITVAPNAAAGPRDILVENLGSAPVRWNDFAITGIYITSISPSASSNETSREVTFTGRGFPSPARAQLVKGGIALEGTNVVRESATTLRATFNFNGAPEGDYIARVLTSDGSQRSADECSPTFEVIDGPGTASPTITPSGSTSPSSTASASPDVTPGKYSCSQSTASTSPTATATGTRSASPSGSPSGTTSSSASPTTSPSPGNNAANVTINVNVQRITSGNAPTLSGTVTDAGGQPVRNREVTLLAKEYNSNTYRAFPADDEVRTDNNGNYTAVVRPIRQTAFVARVDSAQSPSLVIFVFTRVNLDRSAHATTQPRSYAFRGDLDPNAPDLRGAAVGLAVLGRDARGRATFSVINQTVTRNDAAATYTLTGRNGVLPVGTNTFVVFTSARNGLGKGSASVRFTVR